MIIIIQVLSLTMLFFFWVILWGHIVNVIFPNFLKTTNKWMICFVYFLGGPFIWIFGILDLMNIYYIENKLNILKNMYANFTSFVVKNKK